MPFEAPWILMCFLFLYLVLVLWTVVLLVSSFPVWSFAFRPVRLPMFKHLARVVFKVTVWIRLISTEYRRTKSTVTRLLVVFLPPFFLSTMNLYSTSSCIIINAWSFTARQRTKGNGIPRAKLYVCSQSNSSYCTFWKRLYCEFFDDRSMWSVSSCCTTSI